MSPPATSRELVTRVKRLTRSELEIFTLAVACHFYCDPEDPGVLDPDKDVNGGDAVEFITEELKRLGLTPGPR